jgi:hypothetical protein
MHAVLIIAALVVGGECKECQSDPHAVYVSDRRPAPAAVRCPNYTPPVRWYCKPCAGCAGGKCLSCQQPYFGSAPYSYRVQFDYPWSQQPAFPLKHYMYEPEVPIEEIQGEPEFIDQSARKVRTPLKR